jgi:hypothetical protein
MHGLPPVHRLLVEEQDKLQKALEQLQEVDVLQEKMRRYNQGAAWQTVAMIREGLHQAESRLEVGYGEHR